MGSRDARADSTLAVHGGERWPKPNDAITTPIAATATYTFGDTAELVSFMEGSVQREEYGRYGNPTVHALEAKCAALEATDGALAFASGMAAVTTAILALVKSGAHVVLFRDCYRRTRQFVTTTLDRFGVTHTLVEPGDIEGLARAIRPETKLVISEAPTNPYGNVVDLDAMVSVVKKHRGVKTMIDATFATPINLRPAVHGVDLVVHSATKYYGGHNDALGGIVAGPEHLLSLVKEQRDVLGGIMDPHCAYLLLRGLKTLSLRVRQQNFSALAIARALEGHPKVRRVWYPGLESHPSHAVAKRLMTGFGGVVTFELATDLAGAGRFIDALKIPRIAPSLGGVESLVEQPALMSFFELTTEQREAVGIKDALVRYAVGIEEPEALIEDLRAALDVIAP
ncbi:MAG: aminotransferase class I/II-fold pyridoxal phosphate-dependent enzyme [Myxococcales bacterium]|nr:aminotransferase class I/II-fold pyridoxal phosphate-dependent enzyme [Myxococcales bacterium]